MRMDKGTGWDWKRKPVEKRKERGKVTEGKSVAMSVSISRTVQLHESKYYIVSVVFMECFVIFCALMCRNMS